MLYNHKDEYLNECQEGLVHCDNNQQLFPDKIEEHADFYIVAKLVESMNGLLEIGDIVAWDEDIFEYKDRNGNQIRESARVTIGKMTKLFTGYLTENNEEAMRDGFFILGQVVGGLWW